MAQTVRQSGALRWGGWRIAGWSFAALLLALPLVAMQFTDEVNWDETDFIFAGVMIGGTGLVLELAARATANSAYRGAVICALAATFLLIWINLAVGIIGTEDNPLNLLYAAVLAIALAGSVVAQFRPDGMARAMAVAAVAQALAGLIALLNGYFTLVLEMFFIGLWVLSAALFRKAAREQATTRSD